MNILPAELALAARHNAKRCQEALNAAEKK